MRAIILEVNLATFSRSLNNINSSDIEEKYNSTSTIKTLKITLNHKEIECVLTLKYLHVKITLSKSLNKML